MATIMTAGEQAYGTEAIARGGRLADDTAFVVAHYTMSTFSAFQCWDGAALTRDARLLRGCGETLWVTVTAGANDYEFSVGSKGDAPLRFSDEVYIRACRDLRRAEGRN